MPIELGIWRIDQKCEEVSPSSLSNEKQLEDILDADVSIASPNWMLVGRQVHTDCGNYIDLLAINRDDNLVILELKRDRTPREVVSQVLDYASWVKRLDDDDIGRIYENYVKKYHPDRNGESIDEAFKRTFKTKQVPEQLNEDHEMVVVASALDDSTERIVKYLSEDHGVAINVVFFRAFSDGDREYLTRAWFIDPTDVSAVTTAKVAEDWNGEFYVSFGNDSRRNWADAVKYGFVSAGGGSWYSNYPCSNREIASG